MNAEDEYKAVQNLMNLRPPTEGYCFIVSTKWWRYWLSRPKSPSKVIYNLDLVELDKYYEEYIAEKKEELINKECALDNWRHMVLKTNLTEGEDFILVNAEVWKLLCGKYCGLPEIRIFVTNGYPDLFPVTINLEKDISQVKGILVSLNATSEQLYQYIEETENLKMEVFMLYHTAMLRQEPEAKSLLLPRDEITLAEHLVLNGDTIVLAAGNDKIEGDEGWGRVEIPESIEKDLELEESFDNLIKDNVSFLDYIPEVKSELSGTIVENSENPIVNESKLEAEFKEMYIKAKKICGEKKTILKTQSLIEISISLNALLAQFG